MPDDKEAEPHQAGLCKGRLGPMCAQSGIGTEGSKHPRPNTSMNEPRQAKERAERGKLVCPRPKANIEEPKCAEAKAEIPGPS